MLEYPVTMRYLGQGTGHNDVVEFRDEFNGTIISSDNFWVVGSDVRTDRSVELDQYWSIQLKEEPKYELSMPKNTIHGWYVHAEHLLYLRPSGEVLEGTGYGTDNCGYWATFEEAIIAKNKYENPQWFKELKIHSGNTESENQGCIIMNNNNVGYDEHKFFLSAMESIDDVRGNGGMVDYYEVPEGATQLSDLMYHKKMNHSVGEAFCALYRLDNNGERERNIRKVIRYMELELQQCSDHS